MSLAPFELGSQGNWGLHHRQIWLGRASHRRFRRCQLLPCFPDSSQQSPPFECRYAPAFCYTCFPVQDPLYLPRESIPAASRVFGRRGPVRAGLTGGFVALMSQVRTSSKTRDSVVIGGPSVTSFSAVPFTAAEGRTKSCPDSASEAEALRTTQAGALFAGEVVLARAEFSTQVAANARGLWSSNALCGRTW